MESQLPKYTKIAFNDFFVFDFSNLFRYANASALVIPGIEKFRIVVSFYQIFLSAITMWWIFLSRPTVELVESLRINIDGLISFIIRIKDICITKQFVIGIGFTLFVFL